MHQLEVCQTHDGIEVRSAEIESGRGSFAAGAQTNEFLQLNISLWWMSKSSNCDSMTLELHGRPSFVKLGAAE